ncbi:magnesium/cobalt transporter CorA [Litoribacter alkaliphilus]|uniref:Magnesium transport protein CorA n=1 Tax=Litoribacter ruber TaxID=702568 RepID=A0AAP2G4N2_9BACT|nr:magnesium/cobalt transporter CorA [Litoribacter alkaliphilus]MBS9524690.1 magnesium/cobalt transporter CorA [Litoribacter alkaliphilus]
MELYLFGENFFEKHLLTSAGQLTELLKGPHKIWLNISGLGDHKLISELGNLLNIHSLTIEDIMDAGQRPKFEEFDDFVFVSTKMIYTKRALEELEIEQISLLIGPNYVITFQENHKDVFDPIRTRLENPTGRMRKLGSDYFAYTLINAITDHYYKVMEMVSEANEDLEDQIIKARKKVKLEDLYIHRKTLQEIRKNTWPMREIISDWKKSDHPVLNEKNQIYLNDTYEHTIEILENLELQRETITTLVEIYMTQLSIKQNEVMKTLTIIATIFIPLTFIAGVYGMNFTYMPELEWEYSYLIVWVFFILSAGLMLYYFKKKNWF